MRGCMDGWMVEVEVECCAVRGGGTVCDVGLCMSETGIGDRMEVMGM